jgi:hypothetical protein
LGWVIFVEQSAPKDCDERHVKTNTVRRAWQANISIAADIRSERANIRPSAAAKEG